LGNEVSILPTAARIDFKKRSILRSRPKHQSLLLLPQKGHMPVQDTFIEWGALKTEQTGRHSFTPASASPRNRTRQPGPKKPAAISTATSWSRTLPTLIEDLGGRKALALTLGGDLARKGPRMLAKRPPLKIRVPKPQQATAHRFRSTAHRIFQEEWALQRRLVVLPLAEVRQPSLPPKEEGSWTPDRHCESLDREHTQEAALSANIFSEGGGDPAPTYGQS